MIGMLELAPVVLLAAAALYRRHNTRETNREYAGRFAHNADGIAAGAEGFTLEGTNGCAVLLLHGSGDAPNTLRYLATALNTRGYTVRVPLLPGHGRSPAAFSRATAADYYEYCLAQLDELRATHQRVSVAGLSMGGAIAVRLAVVRELASLVLLAPYIIPPLNVRVIAQTSFLWSLISPYLAGRGQASVHDAEASRASRAYGTFSGGALRALAATADASFSALPAVRIPTLVINSDQDNRIPRELAERAIAELRAPKDVKWVTGCGHVITIDYCKEQVNEMVIDFFDRTLAGAAPSPRQ